MREPTPAASSLPTDPKHATALAIHLLLAFMAGFVAVLVFHQGVRAALVAAGVVEATPYALGPSAVTGVPRVLERAFWGGVWGIVLALILFRVPRRPPSAYWVVALVFGALLPSLFAWFIVAPFKGGPIAAGGDPVRLAVGLLTNGVWGVGTAALYRLLLRVRGHRDSATGAGEVPV